MRIGQTFGNVAAQQSNPRYILQALHWQCHLRVATLALLNTLNL